MTVQQFSTALCNHCRVEKNAVLENYSVPVQIGAVSSKGVLKPIKRGYRKLILCPQRRDWRLRGVDASATLADVPLDRSVGGSSAVCEMDRLHQ
jgi:hypothetical protein